MPKGQLIDRLAKETIIKRATSTPDELGGASKTFSEVGKLQMYITSVSGDREIVGSKFEHTQTHVGQTTEISPDIRINDILEQDGQSYRIIDLDGNAANVSICAEYKLRFVAELTNSIGG